MPVIFGLESVCRSVVWATGLLFDRMDSPRSLEFQILWSPSIYRRTPLRQQRAQNTTENLTARSFRHIGAAAFLHSDSRHRNIRLLEIRHAPSVQHAACLRDRDTVGRNAPARVSDTDQARHRVVRDWMYKMDGWRAERSGDDEARIDAIAPDCLPQSKTGA